jgi:hypothetical protein
MAYMGAYTNATEAAPNDQCSNCVNEAKRPNEKLTDAGPDAPGLA